MANENHNISNIIWNAQGLKTVMFFRLVETNSPGWTCMMYTRITDVPFMLTFLSIFKNKNKISFILETCQ